MSEKINGKTPNEIKKGLWCCSSDDKGAHCGNCPYNRGNDDGGCIIELCADVLALIQQPENHIGEPVEMVQHTGGKTC